MDKRIEKVLLEFETLSDDSKNKSNDLPSYRKVERVINDALLSKSIPERIKELKKIIDFIDERGFQINFRKIRIDTQAKLDRLTKDEINKPALSIDEKIELWIDKHIPNSPNKEDYKKAFQVICKQSKPKECSRTFLLEKIHKEFEPSIDDQSIRKRIPDFKNTFPF